MNDFLKDEEVTPLDCDVRHYFHTECIKVWVEKGNNSCPLCRVLIKEV